MESFGRTISGDLTSKVRRIKTRDPERNETSVSALKKYFAASDCRMVWAQRETPRGISSTVKSPEIVLPKLSAMVPGIASGLVTAGPSRALLQGVEIDGSSVESVPIWKTSGRTFCRHPLATRMDRE